VLLVGPIYWSRNGGTGLLGAAAYIMAIVAWFLILLRGVHPIGIREFAIYYLRWRTRALAYMAPLTDAYPPFGTGDHPTTRGVARLMQHVGVRDARVADLGAGSAVLAIAAAKLGARVVTAVELDPDAIGNAVENVERNGVAGVVHVGTLSAHLARDNEPLVRLLVRGR
jgi:ribosomal protein L11 methylase PrmA